MGTSGSMTWMARPYIVRTLNDAPQSLSVVSHTAMETRKGRFGGIVRMDQDGHTNDCATDANSAPLTRSKKPPPDMLVGYDSTSTSSLSWLTTATSTDFARRTTSSEQQISLPIVDPWGVVSTLDEKENKQRSRGVIPLESESTIGVDELLNDVDFMREQVEIMRQISQKSMMTSLAAITETSFITTKSFSTARNESDPLISTSTSSSTSFFVSGGPEPVIPTIKIDNHQLSMTSVLPTTSSFDNNDDDYDFLRFLADPALMQEQQRILDEAQHEHNLSRQGVALQDENRNAISREVDHLTESILYSSLEQYQSTATVGADAPHSPRSERLLSRFHQEESTRLHPSLLRGMSDSVRSDDTVGSHLDDKIVNYGNGKKVRVKGTKHAWKAVADGNAVLVQCPKCSCVLQVGGSAKRLFCTQCQNVSRIETCQLNARVISDQEQHQIARIVQEQEMNVAYARKMAKMYRS